MNVDFDWPSDDEISAFFANRSPLSALPNGGSQVREMLRKSGTEQANAISKHLDNDGIVLVVGRPRDFEAFAAGMVTQLEERGFDVRVGCLWLSPSTFPGASEVVGNQVMGSFIDDGCEGATNAIVATTVLEDWGMATSMLLWTEHQAPQAGLRLVGHRTEERELDAALAEASLAFANEAGPSFAFVDRGEEFDRANEFASLSPVDDQAHVPPFIAHRMEMQAFRRLPPNLTPPPTPPEPTPFKV